MKLEKRDQCPICHHKKVSLHRSQTFDINAIDQNDFRITDNRYGSLWTFYRCHQCEFVFSNPYIPQSQIVDFYSRLIDDEYTQEVEGRGKNFHQILQQLKKIKKPGNRLLDVGAASGIFLNLARKQGYEIQGIEPSDFLVKEAKRLFGIKLFSGTIDQYPQQDRFAVITLLDILEHLVEPDSFMSKIDSLIADKGIIVIVTPDIDSLAASLMGKRWWHYRIAHINFFNLKSLSILLARHGFSIIKKKRYGWNFSLYYLTSRIIPQIKHLKSLQKSLKSINLKLNLFDSWEIYARKY